MSVSRPDLIGMWGHPNGGYLTLRAMVVSGGIRAGVIWAGVVGSYPDMLYNCAPEENPAFWNSISANAYLNHISGTVQLHHGTADSDVPLRPFFFIPNGMF